jgi:hypothetical protein
MPISIYEKTLKLNLNFPNFQCANEKEMIKFFTIISLDLSSLGSMYDPLQMWKIVSAYKPFKILMLPWAGLVHTNATSHS